jgi:hypothetical protein
MKALAKMLLAALGISVLAIGLNFLTSTSASGSNPLAVTVTNTPLAVQAPNGNSTPLPVSVNNVPNVNIASVPAVTLASGTTVGLASGTGVTVTNPLDNSGNPIPVHTRSDDDAGRTPVGARCLTGTIQTNGVDSSFQCTLLTVPAGQRLIAESFSASVLNVNGGIHPVETSIQTSTNGNAFGIDVPLFLQDSNSSGDNLTGQGPIRIYGDPNQAVTCIASFHVQVPTQGILQCAISGQLVSVP